MLCKFVHICVYLLCDFIKLFRTSITIAIKVFLCSIDA